MENLDVMRGGSIVREYRIDCATCYFWDSYDLDSTDRVEKLARLQGWSETTKFGWICPECKTKDRNKLTFWKSEMRIEMLTVDVKCICGKPGEGTVVHKQGSVFDGAVGVGLPRGWGFYIREPERVIVPLCETCKGTKGSVAYPPQTEKLEHQTNCKLPGG